MHELERKLTDIKTKFLNLKENSLPIPIRYTIADLWRGFQGLRENNQNNNNIPAIYWSMPNLKSTRKQKKKKKRKAAGVFMVYLGSCKSMN